MMRYTSVAMAITLLVFLLLQLPAAAQAQQEGSAAQQIGRYLDRDCIGVVRVRIDRLPVEKLLHQFVELVPEAAPGEQQALNKFNNIQEAMLAAGIKDVYVVVSKESWGKEPAYLLIPDFETDRIEVVEKLNAQWQLVPRNMKIAPLEEALFIGPADMLPRVQALDAKPRPELAAAFQPVAEHAIQAVVIPTADDRRVIEQLMPSLPAELGGGPSTLLTHGMRWAAVGIDAKEQLEVRLVVQSADQAAATSFRNVWTAGVNYLTSLEAVKKVAPQLNEATDVLTPQVEGDRLTLQMNQANKSIETLLAALKPPVMEARIRARRTQSMNNLKQLALAMHNFYAVNKRFPAIGTVDATGQPLLSWRVHLLPYVEQSELYDQFHLDEPWDSPHNKTLIEQMPALFASPPSGHDQREGLATYRLVVGEGTAFPGRQGIELKEITDGTSNTIMAVEVNDQHAVTWTKPEGLPFDEKQPLGGIGGQFPGGFHAASCDGAVHFLPQSIDPQKWRLLLLRNDGNPVSWD